MQQIFIMVEDLQDFKTLQTYVNGALVANEGKSKIITKTSDILNNFNCALKQVSDFEFLVLDFKEEVVAIEALDGQLITNKIKCNPIVKKQCL